MQGELLSPSFLPIGWYRSKIMKKKVCQWAIRTLLGTPNLLSRIKGSDPEYISEFNEFSKKLSEKMEN
jgi:hypothetical protein